MLCVVKGVKGATVGKKRKNRIAQITCDRYKEIIINHHDMTDEQKRQLRQHQEGCDRHKRDAGLQRMLKAVLGEA